MQAKRLIEVHGHDAESVATRIMFQKMDGQDVKEATLWMAIVHEIRQISRGSQAIN